MLNLFQHLCRYKGRSTIEDNTKRLSDPESGLQAEDETGKR